MWSIGIKSGFITVLALVAYGLLVDLWHLQASIWGHLDYLVWGLGIYSGYYYYKQAHQGYMTYRQGLQVGFIVTTFTGFLSGLCSYLMIQWIDPSFIKRLLTSWKMTLGQPELQAEHQKLFALMEDFLSPQTFSVLVCLSTCLIGAILNFIMAAFAKNVKTKNAS